MDYFYKKNKSLENLEYSDKEYNKIENPEMEDENKQHVNKIKLNKSIILNTDINLINDSHSEPINGSKGYDEDEIEYDDDDSNSTSDSIDSSQNWSTKIKETDTIESLSKELELLKLKKQISTVKNDIVLQNINIINNVDYMFKNNIHPFLIKSSLFYKENSILFNKYRDELNEENHYYNTLNNVLMVGGSIISTYLGIFLYANYLNSNC